MPITDFDAQQMVMRELEPGEQLFWSGRPGQGIKFRRGDAFAVPFSLMWAGFAFFWEFQAFSSGAPVFFRLWGIPFVLVGAYMVAGRFFADAFRRRNTIYGVTDRRVIIRSGIFSLNTTSHPLKALPAITLSERRSGDGDIVLDSRDMSHVGAGGFVSRGQSVPAALEFIPHARHVYTVLRDAHHRAR